MEKKNVTIINASLGGYQMKRLSYDIKYQNGHAMFLESLNKMLR